MSKLFVHGASVRADGRRDSLFSMEVESKDAPLWWQEKGLSFTATGYGSRIPTRQMVHFNGRWRRVYCRIFSNVGTCFLRTGPGEELIVREYK